MEQLSVNLWSQGNQNKQSAKAQRALLGSVTCSLLVLSPSQEFALFLTIDVVVLMQGPTGGRNSLLENGKKTLCKLACETSAIVSANFVLINTVPAPD